MLLGLNVHGESTLFTVMLFSPLPAAEPSFFTTNIVLVSVSDMQSVFQCCVYVDGHKFHGKISKNCALHVSILSNRN